MNAVKRKICEKCIWCKDHAKALMWTMICYNREQHGEKAILEN